mmetsp:Transcript_16688/g.37404  ORF Transcript_16688/g.37404 Transcript_16688/m.37404 type:complete len:83 (-) Transcript_16688:2849-3097(-)
MWRICGTCCSFPFWHTATLLLVSDHVLSDNFHGPFNLLQVRPFYENIRFAKFRCVPAIIDPNVNSWWSEFRKKSPVVFHCLV